MVRHRSCGGHVQPAGTFDLDAEPRIWLPSVTNPVQKQFAKGVDVYEVQARPSAHVARQLRKTTPAAREATSSVANARTPASSPPTTVPAPRSAIISLDSS